MNSKVLKWNFIFQYGYVITNILNSLFLLPMYVSYIDSKLLGYWLATGNILAWLTMTDPGIAEILQQKIAELKGKDNRVEIEKTMGSGIISSMLIFAISTTIGIGLFYFFYDLVLSKEVRGIADLRNAFIISIFATSVTLLSFGAAGINQGLHNASHVALAFILSNIIFLIVNVALLIMELGIMSIAYANLARAIFLCVYNFAAVRVEVRRLEMRINISKTHFTKFAKVFSFTSLSKIAMSFSNNIDLLLLAKYLQPSLITSFEINRRPIKMTQSLVGRYSVAFMPLISHSKGMGEIDKIKKEITRRFKVYAHVVLLASILFLVTYRDLISLWVGPGQYAGNLIILLLVCNFFFATLGYFVSNMAYAVGDIKANSLIWVIGSSLLIAFSLIGIFFFGLIGMLALSLVIVFIFDFFIFFYRFHNQGYLDMNGIKSIIKVWMILIPFILAICYFLLSGLDWFFPEGKYFIKLIIGYPLIIIPYLGMLFILDRELFHKIKSQFVNIIKKR
jgi:O-antigen/teichoic acid export membrane protein